MTRMIYVALCACIGVSAVACDDTQGPPVAGVSLLPDSAEQMLIGVTFLLTDAGVRRANVRADTLIMYDANTREELRQISVVFFTAEGEQDAVLKALTGMHNNRLGTMEARGNVVVVSKEGETLNTPHLRYDPNRNEISSDSAFTLTEGERVTKGVGFVSNPDMTNMRILAAASVTGSQVKIPRR